MKKQTKTNSSKTKIAVSPGEVSREAETLALPEEAVLDVHLPALPIVGIGASAGVWQHSRRSISRRSRHPKRHRA
jgi:hypothetical protein